MTHLGAIRPTLQQTESGRRALAVCEAARKYMSALDAQTDPARRCEQTYRDMGVLCTQLDIAVRALLDEAPEEHVITEPAKLDGCDILATNTRTDGHRVWWSGGAWLHPGQSIAVIEAPDERPAGGEGGAPC